MPIFETSYCPKEKRQIVFCTEGIDWEKGKPIPCRYLKDGHCEYTEEADTGIRGNGGEK